MRAAPENAFYALQEAVDLLPQAPAHRMIGPEDALGYVGVYRPEHGSIGELLNLGRADSDPVLVEYVEGAGPALAKMREALGKSCLRMPTLEHWKYTKVGRELPRLAHLAVANAIYDVRYRGAAPDPAPLLDVLAVGELASQDGGFFVFPIACEIQASALKYAWDAFLGAAALETRTDLLDRLAEHTLLARSLQPQLEYDWRILDRSDAFWIMNYGTEGVGRRSDTMNIIERMFIGRMLNRIRLKMIEQRELYLEAAKVDAADFERWVSNHGELWQNAIHFDPIQRIRLAQQSRRVLLAWLSGWRIVHELEAYRDTHGSYPESLDAANIREVDPFTGRPYVYRVHPGEFTLYSTGVNEADNGGESWQDRDIVLRRASAEPQPDTAIFGQLEGRRQRRAR